ncbi:lecithin retinol acyltransferase family protein [Paraburkholderia sp. CNPSo 3274]|uniref:lecithin retinol acyltransferase family protein n=1 Tax=Paraburkholderia sp. CNPSo 3274 TaxID=2940932 RepID=UPI0020B8D161|nr:lecithin retinol acyltransferase family protein [Paraburkholderia sp. CNPSo 3274]MCP3710100.1 lecithin retinol acyltransferase family protein [Paraburkholderia sp. CNPSo 3274]
MNQHEAPRFPDVVSAHGLSVGAHLATRRPGYMHHGIYIGSGRVIHYAGLSRCLGRGPIEVISIDHFAAVFGFMVVAHPHSQYTGAEIARRAASRLGEQDYRLLTNNCEHLCLWYVFGQGKSDQVDACIRNPVRAVRVLFTLLCCALIRDCMFASFVRANEVPVCTLNG